MYTIITITNVFQVQVPKAAGHLFRRPVDLDRNAGPSAIPGEIPVVTGYLMRICEIS